MPTSKYDSQAGVHRAYATDRATVADHWTDIKISEISLRIAHFRTSLSCTDTSEVWVFAYVDAFDAGLSNSMMHGAEPCCRH